MPTIDEFHNLLSYENKLEDRKTTAQGERFNKVGGFNLVPSNLPFDQNRIKLKKPVDGYDYVNASWLDSVREHSEYDQVIYSSISRFNNIRFAVGQTPLPSTMTHHFRMVHENRFKIVLSFSEEENKAPFQINQEYNFNDLTLKVTNRTKLNQHLFRSEIALYDTSSPNDHYVHYAVCFEFSSWPRDEVRSFEDTGYIVSSFCLIRSQMKFDGSGINVLVHDSSGGVRGSALFIIMYELMEKVDESLSEDGSLKKFIEEIDVFKMVNQLRIDRANMIDDFDTYKLIFRCLGYYGPNRNTLNLSISKNGTENERCVMTSIEENGNEQNFQDNVEDAIDDPEDGVYVYDGVYVDEENVGQRHEYQNMSANNENQQNLQERMQNDIENVEHGDHNDENSFFDEYDSEENGVQHPEYQNVN